MKSQKYDSIFKEINKIINNGQADSLLQKLEFNYSIENETEFSNYIVILLVLMENQYTYTASSTILLKNVLAKNTKFSFIRNSKDAFEIIRNNKVLPYRGISETIRRLMRTVINKHENDFEIISNWPDKGYLVNFNVDLLKNYLKEFDYKNNITIGLLYGCFDDIVNDIIMLNKEAVKLFKDHLLNNSGAFIDYLHEFIRFYYQGGSRDWDEGKRVVPEPFYIQIFGSESDFLNFIDVFIERNDIDFREDKIYDDVKNFVKKIQRNQFINYDDAGLQIELHKNLYEELKKG